MSFSFNDDLSTDLDYVRFYIGDTDSSNYLVEDATITAILSTHSNPLNAAIVICRNLTAKYSSMASQSIGSVSVSYGDISKKYQSLVVELKAMLADQAGIYAGGLSQAEKDTDADDDDLTQSTFKRDTITNG